MVDHVISQLETQHRLVGVDPVLTIIVALGPALAKLLVNDVPHDLAFF